MFYPVRRDGVVRDDRHVAVKRVSDCFGKFQGVFWVGFSTCNGWKEVLELVKDQDSDVRRVQLWLWFSVKDCLYFSLEFR